MKKTIRTAYLLFFSVSLMAAVVPSCVTVNVNFPEAAIQQATDDYVQELYKEKEKGKPQPTPTVPGTSPVKKPATVQSAPNKPRVSYLDWTLFISSAVASEQSPDGEMKIKVNSPKAMAIRERQVARLDKIHDAKIAGQIGENNLGSLTLDPGSKLKPDDKAKLQSLVDTENKDRKELYDEILLSNGYNSSRLIDLQKSFARSFQAHSASGSWIQDDGDQWARKP